MSRPVITPGVARFLTSLAVETLPPLERAVFEARVLTVPPITQELLAEALGVHVDTVRRATRRASSAVREFLDDPYLREVASTPRRARSPRTHRSTRSTRGAGRPLTAGVPRC